MQPLLMASKKSRPPGSSKPGDGPKKNVAFDVWLQRGLQQLFDDVAREPIPEDLLRLIEDDKSSS